MLGAAGMPGNVEGRGVGRVASADGTEFPCEQSHQGKPNPLTKAKGLRKLPLGVLKGGSNRVYGGKGQSAPRAAEMTSQNKVLRMPPGIKLIRKEEKGRRKKSEYRSKHGTSVSFCILPSHFCLYS